MKIKRNNGLSKGGLLIVCALCVCMAATSGGPVWAAADDLGELSLEELLNLEVTSVSKKPERQRDAAAAIFVITSEDLRRSGVRTIPDALRMVPGLAVAQLDAFKWSVSSRGFGGRFSNKLLVLVDGRSVYTPQFSGVYWEAVNIMIEDVARIEVIRGPGGTLWGANAVNGVINIVTKPAAETQGGLVTAGGGTEMLGSTSLRFGGALPNDKGYFRSYGKFFQLGTGTTASGSDADDGGTIKHGGFRIDTSLSLQDTLTIQGDVFSNRSNAITNLPVLGQPLPVPTKTTSPYKGFNLVANWNHTISDESDWQLKMYYDHYSIESITSSSTYDIVDLDFQHRREVGGSHEFVWGLGVRYWWDEQVNTDFIVYNPRSESSDVFSGFFQDQITLGEKFVLTLGSKIEHNSSTGWEIQPNARLAWKPDSKHTLWGAVSRAVRTPSRAEDDILLVDQAFPGGLVILIGSRDFDSEKLWAFEAGYRSDIANRLVFDVAAFYNRYTDLRTIEQGAPIAGPLPGFNLPPHIVVPATANNNMRAEAYGFELVADYKPKEWWSIRAFYAFLETDVDIAPGVVDPISGVVEGNTPEQHFYLQNSFQLPHDMELDAVLRYVDRLPTLGVEDYVTADVRLGWRPKENLEISVVGRNLFEPEHFEFSPKFVNTSATQVERSLFGMVSWTF